MKKAIIYFILAVMVYGCSPCKIIYCDPATKSDPVLMCKNPERFWPDFVKDHENTIKLTLNLLEEINTNVNFDITTKQKSQLLFKELSNKNTYIRDLLEADYRQLSEKPCDKDYKSAHIQLMSDLQKDLSVVKEFSDSINKITNSNNFGGSFSSALQDSYDKYITNTFIKSRNK